MAIWREEGLYEPSRWHSTFGVIGQSRVDEYHKLSIIRHDEKVRDPRWLEPFRP